MSETLYHIYTDLYKKPKDRHPEIKEIFDRHPIDIGKVIKYYDDEAKLISKTYLKPIDEICDRWKLDQDNINIKNEYLVALESAMTHMNEHIQKCEATNE